MLPSNPSTPPQDDFAEFIDFNIGASIESNLHSDIAPFAIPEGNANYGGFDEARNMADRSEASVDTDDDQDMSEGGAALTLTMSHAEQLNTEMDILDAEVMGHDNLLDLVQDTQYTSLHSHNALGDDQDVSDEEMDEEESQLIISTPTFSAAMAEVSQQLAHIQNGQGHMNLEIIQSEQHGVVANSIEPYLFSPLFSDYEAGPESQASVSTAGISTANLVIAATGPHNVIFPWGFEGSNPSPSMNVTMPSAASLDHFFPTDFGGANEQAVADNHEVEDIMNMCLEEFLYTWGTSAGSVESRKRSSRAPSVPELLKQRDLKKLPPVRICDLQGDLCDIQRIDWEALGVSRFEAKQMRRRTYKNYTNLRSEKPWQPRLHGARLDDDDNFFRFRRMDFNHKIHLAHFQLRNIISCASRDRVFYAGKSKVILWNPSSDTNNPRKVVLDLKNPVIQPVHAIPGGVQISTLTSAHNILVAGGFSGEYGLVNLAAHKDSKHTEGIITDNINGITNHVQVHLSRSCASPRVAFASNDSGMRILDVETNKFLSEHRYDHAINCTAISPDRRLRVLVGDTRQVMICNAETGEILQNLEGHRDFGFACDWADDGWTVATGNQDMQIKIWDARKWTTSQGIACPIATVAAELAGVRNLQFSPLGSGKRVLAAAEPADIVSIIDAETFSSKQTLSFFGEIGGLDFTNGGQDLMIANCDNMRGGLMEYERCNWASGSLYGLDCIEDRHNTRLRRGSRSNKGYDWEPNIEDVTNHPKSSRTAEHRRRRPAALGTEMGYF